jgi:hypothetical protein
VSLARPASLRGAYTRTSPAKHGPGERKWSSWGVPRLPGIILVPVRGPVVLRSNPGELQTPAPDSRRPN